MIPIGTVCLVLIENGTPIKGSLVCIVQSTWDGRTGEMDYGPYEVRQIHDLHNQSFAAHFHEHQLLVCTDLEQILYRV